MRDIDVPNPHRLKQIQFMTSRFLLTIAALMLAAGSAHGGAKDFLKKSDTWFAGDEARKIATNILSFQSRLGGWPKNDDTTARAYKGDHSELKATYDNGATTDELRFLGRIYSATKETKYQEAFDRGLDYVLNGQYENGGWPQRSPPGNSYHRHITFNDDAMVRLLYFVREVATTAPYDFVDEKRRKSAAAAFNRGIECILKCQITVDGTLTAWCAQHDEVDFRPQSARTYELATLSASESVGITRLLMSIDDPSPEIVKSVEAAVAWFGKAGLTGIRVDTEKDKKAPKGQNRVVIADSKAKPVWARFYSIQTNAPVFVDRDGIPKSSIAEISYERRNGYAWYGSWPQKVLDNEYQEWKKRIAAGRTPNP
jgi:pectate lyase